LSFVVIFALKIFVAGPKRPEEHDILGLAREHLGQYLSVLTKALKAFDATAIL